MTAAPLQLLIDGADPQAGGMAGNPWFTLAAHLAADPAVKVTWLDRGHAPRAAGTQRLPFPSHRRGACAADSLLIQQVCDELRIDVFASTGWTTPAGTPSMCLVDETWLDTPAALAPQAQEERNLALMCAQRIVCASDRVRRRVPAQQPGIDALRLVLAALNWQTTPVAEWASVLAVQSKALLQSLVSEARSDEWKRRATEWRRLRQLQANVDT